MEQEVRNILQKAVSHDVVLEPISFAQRIQQRFQGIDAGDLPVPLRNVSRKPPTL